MGLIDEVFRVCNSLGDDWADLFAAHGLAIRQTSPATLENELLNQSLHVDRGIPGFEDFVADIARAIVPRQPAHSLLYHALASPNVSLARNGVTLAGFPSLDEIEIIENYVFGSRPPSVEDLLAEARAERLSVVVFAYEYRPASQTCHRKHADLAFARAGIARVGTEMARYVDALRGFLPESEGGGSGIHVSPARYGAFLAAMRFGSRKDFLPMRFRDRRNPDTDPSDWVPDNERAFWIPIHKLFPGKECLRSVEAGALNVQLTFSGSHFNEKLLRLHKALGANPPPTAPYIMNAGIAHSRSRTAAP
jgi:hypothetical protein